ncbi:MAG: monofunctional biosynthetic peptidoglycan transglycosylase [Paludibacter sp.]|nr:monofunctional biosynthetic peptidoglycan transglycosylase [Paludibacter sp.]
MKSKNKKDTRLRRFFRFCRNAAILFFAISILWVLVARFVPVWITPLVYIRAIESVFDKKLPHCEKTWVSIDKISPNMVQAVIASEDNLFAQHNGFSLTAIEKAIEHNKKGKRIRGGSTISQQTAKNVFLFPQRSYVRKGLEAYYTVLIEFIWGKKRIMEVYLNVIEMGDGVYGVEAAAQKYFHTSASRLTKEQSALIAASLPNPRRYSIEKPSPYIKKRQAAILRLMRLISQPDFLDKK